MSNRAGFACSIFLLASNKKGYFGVDIVNKML